MALRYSDRPQLQYGRQQPADNSWRERFPQNAQPIATAPKHGGENVWVFEPDGNGYLAMHYKGQWQKLAEERDDRDGSTRVTMMGEAVANPTMWAPAKKR